LRGKQWGNVKILKGRGRAYDGPGGKEIGREGLAYPKKVLKETYFRTVRSGFGRGRSSVARIFILAKLEGEKGLASQPFTKTT